jgi:hypothetical protein
MADSRTQVSATLSNNGDVTGWLHLEGWGRQKTGRSFFRVDILGSSTFANASSALTIQAKGVVAAEGVSPVVDADTDAFTVDSILQTDTPRTKTGEVAGEIYIRAKFVKAGADSLKVRITRANP